MTEPIKTWRERIGVNPDYPLHAPTDVERAMVAEIAELRAVIELLETPRKEARGAMRNGA